MQKIRLAVLISGRGSNLQALIDACKNPSFPAQIVTVIANKADAVGLERAADAGIPAMIVDSSFFKGDKAGFEASLTQTIKQFDVDLICLAGFMRLLSKGFLDQFKDKVINIHPSLLPKYKGLDTHARAIADNAKNHGCTVHVVTPVMDAGDIIIQKSLTLMADDTEQSLAARVLTLEHAAYPEAVRAIAQKDIIIQNGKVIKSNAPTYREKPMTKTDHSHGSQTPTAHPQAVHEAHDMWHFFIKISAYAGGAVVVVLVLLALFVA